jgi:pimeloyl-ACP methyl ester carboxylesterase
MFTDICNALPKEWGYILFDYNRIEGKDLYLRSYNQQVRMLQAVCEWAIGQGSTASIVGHSLGAVVGAIAQPKNVRKLILLAPPVHTSRSRAFWESYPGARWQKDTLVVPRKDGTVTHIHEAFFVEGESFNPLDAIIECAKGSTVEVVQALEEDILRHTENYDLLAHNPLLTLTRMHGNHNFDAPHRASLVGHVIKSLTA